MTRVIEDAGDDDYTLLVTDTGAVEARKRIPHDGVRYYSTASRDHPTGKRTQSEFNLSLDEVLNHYVTRADTSTPVAELRDAITDGADAGSDGGDDDGSDVIPEPFAAMPKLDAPSDRDRELAEMRLPPHAIPDDGPIPDYYHQHTVEAELTVPAWALAAACYRLEQHDPVDVDASRVREILSEYAASSAQFVTPDGRDATTVLLNEVTSNAKADGCGGEENGS